MEKHQLSVIQVTLLDWKYDKKYTQEMKTFEIKDKLDGLSDIILKNKIKIINKGGSFDLRIEPVKFHTTTAAIASPNDEAENERLKDFLRAFDNEVYIQSEQSEANTEQRIGFFER